MAYLPLSIQGILNYGSRLGVYFSDIWIAMKKKKGFYIGIGLMIGTLIGVSLDNIGLWLSLGLVFGVSIENSKQSKKK